VTDESELEVVVEGLRTEVDQLRTQVAELKTQQVQVLIDHLNGRKAGELGRALDNGLRRALRIAGADRGILP